MGMGLRFLRGPSRIDRKAQIVNVVACLQFGMFILSLIRQNFALRPATVPCLECVKSCDHDSIGIEFVS